MADVQESQYTIGALLRGLEVLGLFTQEHPTRTFTEVVEALQMSKSTGYRVLATLESAGYLVRDNDRRFRPGLKILDLGFTAILGLNIRQVARPHLESVSKATQETTSLAVLDGSEIVYLDRIRNRAIVGLLLDVGSRVPAYCTGLGKALLSALDSESLRSVLAATTYERFTPNTIVDLKALEAELERTRNRGYAINDQELAMGLRTVAAPVRGREGTTLAAIGISGPTTTMSMDRIQSELGPIVVRAAADASRDLGAV